MSELEVRARLSGLFGDERVFDVGRGVAVFDRLADLSDNFTLEGGNGLANGDGVCVGALVKIVAGGKSLRFCGDEVEGERGDFGDELGDFCATRRNLEGERESDRRSDLTADETST